MPTYMNKRNRKKADKVLLEGCGWELLTVIFVTNETGIPSEGIQANI